MDDIDYAKYILNKYIKFPNTNAKNQFIERLRKNHIKNQSNYAYQFTNALVIASKSSKIDNERETNLLDENQKLKDEIFEWKQRAANNIKSCKQVIKQNNEFKQQIKNKDLEIKNLKYDLDILNKKYNNLKNGEDSHKGISVLEPDSDYEMDSEYGSDPEDELNKGLH